MDATSTPFGYLQPDPEFRTAEDFPYDGPAATVANLAESFYWSLSDAEIERTLLGRGWATTWHGRVPTPYGLGPVARTWATPSGRSVLWIRDYGRTAGGDFILRRLTERTLWMLWKAGVATAIASAHTGIADWRQGDDRVEPGDVVIPWTFESKPWFRGLAGTRFESTMNNPEVVDTRTIPWPYYDRPMAARAAEHFLGILRPRSEAGEIGRIWTPDDVRGVMVDMPHLGFESHYDVYQSMVLNRLVSESQPDRPPVVTLHGAVVNPVLAGMLEIELLQVNVISNLAAGLQPVIGGEHDRFVYDATAARRWLRLDAEFLETYEPTTR